MGEKEARMMKSRDWLARVTHSVRYDIIKIIAPAMYQTVEQIERATICFIKDTNGDAPLIGVEIGVYKGLNAESILKMLNIKKLYLVDPYQPYVQDNVLLPKFASAKGEAYGRLKKYGSRVEFVYKCSADAASLIPEALDFVYIDGNHDYEYVRQDIASYFPKVKQKGVIGGHDFSIKSLGVVRAAAEFAVSNSLELMIDRDDWWVQKGLMQS
jgi:hypothetical protein